MCGFAGYINFKTSVQNHPEVISKMTNKIMHRGPDDSGIWIDPDNTPFVESNEPVIPLDTLTLPVNVCVSSAELPNKEDPESNSIDELINSDLNSWAVTVPSTTKLPDISPEPDTVKWCVSKSYLKLPDAVRKEDETLFDPDLIWIKYCSPTAVGK